MPFKVNRSRPAQAAFRRWVLALFATLSYMEAANYSLTRTADTVTLKDAAHQTIVSVDTSKGNTATLMEVKGKPVYWMPPADPRGRPSMGGNPFLGPWANRLDHEGFFFGEHHYKLNPDIKNYNLDGNKQPIHGLLVYSHLWKVIDATATESDAHVTSQLEFWKYPELMAQFPFAHTLEMTYRLKNGALEVSTTIRNLGASPMPVAIGFHPYFQVTDAPRDEWQVSIPAKDQVVLSPTLVPTGERKPSPYGSPFSLKGVQLDDVFTNLTGREFSVQGKSEKITVEFGPKYPVGVVYAPAGRGFICFEPMTGVTNAINLAHAGKYPELQTVPAGGVWTESYFVRPTGY